MHTDYITRPNTRSHTQAHYNTRMFSLSLSNTRMHKHTHTHILTHNRSLTPTSHEHSQLTSVNTTVPLARGLSATIPLPLPSNFFTLPNMCKYVALFDRLLRAPFLCVRVHLGMQTGMRSVLGLHASNQGQSGRVVQ